MTFHYYIFNKPYKVLSQFTQDVEGQITLKDYLDLPKDVYPIGRLDQDSEGLLLLSNDGKLKNDLLHPNSGHSKTYCAQVEGEITPEAIRQLTQGVEIKLKKTHYQTLPCEAEKIDDPGFEKRNPPVRHRKTVPTSWLKITITEGKNRQVRKMCAKVGFPVLRLIRTGIVDLEFNDVVSGSHRTLTDQEIKHLLQYKSSQ